MTLKNNITQDVCANPGTGLGANIPACSPASNFGGTTAEPWVVKLIKWRTATKATARDFDELTIRLRESPCLLRYSRARSVQVSTETLGGINYICPSPYFVVFDRDFSGTQVSAHNSNGDDDPWEYGQLYSHVIGKGAVVESGGWVNGDDLVNGNGVNSIDNLVLAPTREDGYAVRGLTIQGVRSYDSNTEQWTTPDAYKGDVDDPASQRSYMWNNNNPVAYQDPSGYDTSATIVEDEKAWFPQETPKTDVYVKVEASGSAMGVNVSISAGVTTAPGGFVQVGATVGAGEGASVGGGIGVLSPTSGNTTSGIVSGPSPGGALSYGLGVERYSNNSGTQTGITFSTPTQGQGGLGGSYGFYFGAPGAVGGSSTPHAPKRKPRPKRK